MYVEATTRPSLLLRMRNLSDRTAWNTFIEVYGPLVYGYARRRGLQDADAAEVTQEVLTQVSQSIGSFDYEPQRGTFRGWLGAIARSKVCKLMRRRKQAKQAGGEDVLSELEASDADTLWDEQCKQHLLHLAMRRIRPRFEDATWQAFELAWLHDESADAVARKLKCDVQFVYVAKSRVLKKLREEVCELADDTAILS